MIFSSTLVWEARLTCWGVAHFRVTFGAVFPTASVDSLSGIEAVTT
jgi:hypothetical protein